MNYDDEFATVDVGQGMVHYRDLRTDRPTPCGLDLTAPRQTLSTASEPDLVDCPICHEWVVGLRGIGVPRL